MTYKCSLCNRRFLFPDDRDLQEGAIEVWEAFHDHLREVHAEDVGSRPLAVS